MLDFLIDLKTPEELARTARGGAGTPARSTAPGGKKKFKLFRDREARGSSKRRSRAAGALTQPVTRPVTRPRGAVAVHLQRTGANKENATLQLVNTARNALKKVGKDRRPSARSATAASVTASNRKW